MLSWFALGTSLWLGILTAISPCPLAANVAAMSFISRQLQSRSAMLFSGLLYTCGRGLVYLVLGVIISSGLLASAQISRFLQQYLNEILGPLLILLGMVLLGMIGGSMGIQIAGEKIQKKAAKNGALYAFPLGVILALSFCPVSAGLFFGALIPLSVNHNSSVVLPLIYGVGTAVPVVFFAILIGFGSKWLGSAFKRLNQIEYFVRHATGIIFILVGIYYCLSHIYQLPISIRG